LFITICLFDLVCVILRGITLGRKLHAVNLNCFEIAVAFFAIRIVGVASLFGVDHPYVGEEATAKPLFFE
jgi:hypothetical protein